MTSIKDVLRYVGSQLLTQESLDHFYSELLKLVESSDNRIAENSMMMQPVEMDEDEEYQDAEIIEENNKQEYNL